MPKLSIERLKRELERSPLSELTGWLEGLSRQELNRRDRCGHTLLHSAIQDRSTEKTAYLLSLGADPNAGMPTVLYTAVDMGELALVRLLLRHGADPDLADPRAFTAMTKAILQRRFEIGLELLSAGASLLGPRDENGDRADLVSMVIENFSPEESERLLQARLSRLREALGTRIDEDADLPDSVRAAELVAMEAVGRDGGARQ